MNVSGTTASWTVRNGYCISNSAVQQTFANWTFGSNASTIFLTGNDAKAG